MAKYFDASDRPGQPSEKDFLEQQYSSLRQRLYDEIFPGPPPIAKKDKPVGNPHQQQENFAPVSSHWQKGDVAQQQPYFTLDSNSSTFRREQEMEFLDRLRAEFRQKRVDCNGIDHPQPGFTREQRRIENKQLIVQNTDRQLTLFKGTCFRLPEGTDIAKHAHELGQQHPGWWVNEGPHCDIRKCNLFADRVYRDIHVPLPWDLQHIPTVHGMHQQLARSSEWQLVYSAKLPLTNYHPQPGDLALWDKTVHSTLNGRPWSHSLEHCGIIDGNGVICYAGAWRGYAESDFKEMCSSEAFTGPSAVYRSKHVRH